MIRAVVGQDRIASEWFAKATGHIVSPPFVAIGFTRTGEELCGAALFNDYNGANVEIHLHAPNCLNRTTTRVVLDFVFNQLKCVRLTGRPYRSNKKLRKMLPRLGFVFEATMKSFYGTGKRNDAMVYRLDRAKAERWFNA